jgi:hypothetical protein
MPWWFAVLPALKTTWVDAARTPVCFAFFVRGAAIVAANNANLTARRFPLLLFANFMVLRCHRCACLLLLAT